MAVNVSFIPLHIPVSPVMVILGMAIESNPVITTVSVTILFTKHLMLLFTVYSKVSFPVCVLV